MRFLKYHRKLGITTPEAAFDHFMGTLTASNRTWDYYINWEKVNENIDRYRIELNILNSLCESEDFDRDLKTILTRYPEVTKVFPILIGTRDDSLHVLAKEDLPEFTYSTYHFGQPLLTAEDQSSYINFFDKSKLKSLIQNGHIKNLVDYARGVEVGLDSNGRKNRGGSLMEDIVFEILTSIHGIQEKELLLQATPKTARNKWGIELPVDKSTRRPDFLIYRNDQLTWIECSFYSGGGSKLKATAGEYRTLDKFCANHNINFIWVTDGSGWHTTRRPLLEAFHQLRLICSLEQLKQMRSAEFVSKSL